jgi:hypothetical protein
MIGSTTIISKTVRAVTAILAATAIAAVMPGQTSAQDRQVIDLMPVSIQGDGPAQSGLQPGPVAGSSQRVYNSPVVGTGFPAAETVSNEPVSYGVAVRDELGVLGAVTSAWLDFFSPREYHKLRPLDGRTGYLDVPSDARRLDQTSFGPLPVAGFSTPSLDGQYVSPQSIDDLIAWYEHRHGLRFASNSYTTSRGNSPVEVRLATASKRIHDVVVSITLVTPTLNARGRAYRGIDRSSTSIFIEERGFRHRSELVAEGERAVVELDWNVPFHDLIEVASLKYRIDPYLLAALVKQESGFDPDAISVDSARGLAQLIPETADALGVIDPHDPSQAVDGGARYLKVMLRRYHGKVEYALAAYNAGPGAVDRYNGIPPYAETRDYVRRIMSTWRHKAMGIYDDGRSRPDVTG